MHPWGGGAVGSLGFTLAEALLTLLIISIIVALSTEIIAKYNKKLQANNMSHYWYCTRKSADGSHIQGSNFFPLPGTVSANGCVFNPPAGVQKFNVTVIGGGGGGASGYATLNPEKVYSKGTYTFSPSKDGQYYVILAGGGGGGGGNNWKCGRGDQGGRSAALIADYIPLKRSVYYSIVVGKAGTGANGSHQGGSGEDTTFSGGGLQLVAGGGGGGRRRTPNFPWGCSNKGGGDPGKYSPSEGESKVNGWHGVASGNKYGAYIMYNQERNEYKADTIDVANKLPDVFKNAGCGGRGLQARGVTGCDGVAMIQHLDIFGGGGGQAGNSAFYQFKKSPGQTLVTIGKGGYGATTVDTNGKNGSATRFGYKIIAGGGSGGLTRAASASGNSFYANGENGYRSLMPLNIADEYTTSAIALGGDAATPGENAITPGAGGGGGGSNGRTTEWSAGGNGAPGIVLVVW